MYLTDSREGQAAQWVPYFGNQFGREGFVTEAIEGLFGRLDDVMFLETNAGSWAIAHHLQLEGANVFANDISAYSEAIGYTLSGYGDNEVWEKRGDEISFVDIWDSSSFSIQADALAKLPTFADRAALGAALLSSLGYDLSPDNVGGIEGGTLLTMWQMWKQLLHEWSIKMPTSILREDDLKRFIARRDLHDYLADTQQVDVVYMDFAWPWRDGRGTQEYGAMVDILSSGLTGKDCGLDLWTGENILHNVRVSLELAEECSKYVILSNQSSNFPTHEVLIEALYSWGLVPMVERTLTTRAQYVDNRGLDDRFVEYQYIFKGKIG